MAVKLSSVFLFWTDCAFPLKPNCMLSSDYFPRSLSPRSPPRKVAEYKLCEVLTAGWDGERCFSGAASNHGHLLISLRILHSGFLLLSFNAYIGFPPYLPLCC